MEIDLDEIEKAAINGKSSTVEPYHVQPLYHWRSEVEIFAVHDKHSMQIAQCGISRDFAEFIAHCSPDVVLELVRRVRELEKRCHIVEYQLECEVAEAEQDAEPLTKAVRYLWRAWAEAEGSGQVEVAVFGDPDIDNYLAANDEPVPPRASPEVQAIIREVVDP